MKTFFKKSLATISAISLIAMNMASLTVNAANRTVVNNTSTTTALNVTFGTNFTTSQTVTISARLLDGTAGTIDISSVASDVTIGGTQVASVTSSSATSLTVVTDGTTVTTGNISIANAVLPNNAKLAISVNSSSDYGLGIIDIGTPTSNIVNVSANVAPTLSMALSSTTMALGTLSTLAYQSANTTVTVSTNAQGGATVAMASAGLKDSTIAKEIGVTDIAGGVAQTSATDYYKVSTNGTPVLTDVNDALANAGGTDMLATQNVYTTSGPVSAAATTVTVGSKIAATTEAGNYSDTLTFSVTGTF